MTPVLAFIAGVVVGALGLACLLFIGIKFYVADESTPEGGMTEAEEARRG